ncbi:MAG: lipopolysaccharide biosynthesis protein [Gammaproteobacteria bacterium]|nr:lipopolysaccharide biosynthesis protein [Gammaproteobacteria bacterium]
MSTPTPADGNSPRSLGTRVTIGAAWMVGVRWVVRSIGAISTIVLARLLIPEDFGLVALAAAYIGLAEGFTAMPIGQALIRFQDAGRAMYDTAWTFSVLRGLLIALLMVVSAGPIAGLMNDDRLELVIYVLAVKPFLDGLINTRFIDFQKELQFATPALIQVVDKVVQVTVTIIAVVILRNYWALVIGTLTGSLVHLVLTYAFKPNLPRLTLSEFRPLFGFSGWVSARQMVAALNKQFDKFLVGAYLNTGLVGIYHLGKELTRMPTRELVPPLTRALYPGLAKFRDDPALLRTNAIEASAITAALALPIAIGFALIAEEFVIVLLGKQWLGVVLLIQVITPVVAMHQTTALLDALVMVRGKTHLLFIRAVANLVVRVALMIPGVIYFGFNGIIGAWALTSLIFFFYRQVEYGYVIEARAFSSFIAAWRSVVSVAVMALVILFMARWFTISPDEPLRAGLALLAKVATGAVVYPAVHLALWLVSGRPAGIERRLHGMLGKRFPGLLAST